MRSYFQGVEKEANNSHGRSHLFQVSAQVQLHRSPFYCQTHPLWPLAWESICFRGSILWKSIPNAIKSSETVASFRKKKPKHGLGKDAIVNHAAYCRYYGFDVFRLTRVISPLSDHHRFRVVRRP